MSTYLYLECLDHDPPLRADGESGQHLDDLPQLRADIAARDGLVAVAAASAGEVPDLGHFFRRNTGPVPRQTSEVPDPDPRRVRRRASPHRGRRSVMPTLRTISYYVDTPDDLLLSKQGDLVRVGVVTDDGFVEIEMPTAIAHHVWEFLNDIPSVTTCHEASSR